MGADCQMLTPTPLEPSLLFSRSVDSPTSFAAYRPAQHIIASLGLEG
jgi:hypothetical protein